MLAGEVNYLLFGYLLQVVVEVHLTLPRQFQIEGLFHTAHASAVAFVLADFTQFEVIDAGLEQPVGETALLQAVDLLQQNVADLLQGLSRFGAAVHHHIGVVMQHGGGGTGAKCALLLVDVQVDQTGVAVGEQHFGQHHHGNLCGVGVAEAPCDAHILGILSNHLLHDRGCDLRLRSEGEGRDGL